MADPQPIADVRPNPGSGQPTAAPNPVPASPTPSSSGKRVLIIEDEHFISELYTRALTKAGYQVTNVIDGIEGLKQALTDQYDIILLDIMIPNLMGTEILHRLRDPKNGAKVHAKIILATNLDQGEEGRAATEKYADGYIIKADITPRELVAYLDKIKV